MRISKVEKITGITKRNIHFFIEEKLLNPAKSNNNYYDFNDEDIKKLNIINQLRLFGISMQSIKALLNNPFCLNFEVYETIERLKKEITERQIQIENLIALTEHMPPNANIYNLEKYLTFEAKNNPSTFNIDHIYPINSAYMTTIFLCVPYVGGEPTIYQRYIWNKIAEALSFELGNTLDLLNRIIDMFSIDKLNLVSADIALIVQQTLTSSDALRNEEITATLNRFLNNDELVNKWKILYIPLISKINHFYEAQSDLFNLYTSDYLTYHEKINKSYEHLLAHNPLLLDKFKQKTHRYLELSDLIRLNTFEHEFYNLISYNEMQILLKK